MCLIIDETVKIPDDDYFKAYKIVYKDGRALCMPYQYRPEFTKNKLI